jgi:membrane-associated protein
MLLHINLISLLQTIGYLGLFGIVFAESGLLVGFFLPGDTLLFTAGLLCATHFFSLPIVITLGILGALLGDSFGYYFGKITGARLFKREDSWFFNKKNLTKSQDFYKEHGTKTILLARFVPIVRTFAPILAGTSQMHYKTFLKWNVFGGIVWVTLMTLLGYGLGNSVPNIDHYILPIILVIFVLSFVPIFWNVLKERNSK